MGGREGELVDEQTSRCGGLLSPARGRASQGLQGQTCGLVASVHLVVCGYFGGLGLALAVMFYYCSLCYLFLFCFFFLEGGGGVVQGFGLWVVLDDEGLLLQLQPPVKKLSFPCFEVQRSFSD